MKRRRAIVDPADLDSLESGGALPRSAVGYLTDVLRLGQGDIVEIGDGEGRLLTGELTRAGAGWTLINRKLVSLPPAREGERLILWSGLLKPDRFRLVVEKAVELGVDTLQPFLGKHSAVRPPAAKGAKLLERWTRIARDTTKQCARLRATTVLAPKRLHDLTVSMSDCNRVFATFDGAPVAELRLDRALPTVLAVGPEGGFAESECERLRERGFQGLSLGRYTLRAETACVASVVLVREALGLSAAESGGPESEECP